MLQTRGGDLVNVATRPLLLVALQFLGRGLAGRFGGQHRMLKIDGDHARPALVIGQRRRNLQDALPAHKVHLKGRTQRIAQIAHAMNLAAGLAQQGIIHRRDQRLGFVQVAIHNLAHQFKDLLVFEALLRIEAIVGRPILLLAVLGPEQPGDGMPAKAHQAAEHMPAAAFERLWGAETVAAAVHEFLQTV